MSKAVTDMAGQKLGLAGGAEANDAFQNLLARTGVGSSSLENGTDYPLTRLTLNFWQLVSLFEGSWLARRVVEAPAADIVKTWPTILGETKPEDLAKFKRKVTKTNTKSKVLEALTWGRLFGGAGALIVVKGHEHELDKPLDLDKVGIGAYRGLVVFDRWSGISPAGDVCDDFDSPLDVGLPEFYDVHAKSSSETMRVHSSRILRFCGPKMPEPENSVYQGWGISVLAPVMQALMSYDNVSANALSLSYRANLIGMRMPELAQILSGVGISQKAAQQFAERMAPVNQMLSNQSLVMLPQDGELSNVQYSFGGLAELIQMFQLQMAGAAKMPVSLLWGRLFNGLGNSGEGDERIYEKTVATEADTTLRPALEKLFPVIMASELGEVPDDMELNFPSIRVLDEKEKADLAKGTVDSVVVCLNSGLFSPRKAGMEIKQASDINGFGTNLTDEDIDKLSDEVSSEGELGEGLFGPESEGGGLSPTSSPAKVIKEEDKQAKKLPEAVQGVKPVPVEGNGSPKPKESAAELPGAKKVGPAAKAEDAGMSPEMVWIEACENESDTVPKALRGTWEGEVLIKRGALNNLQFYAEQFKVPYAKCLAYVRGRGIAHDVDSPGPEIELHGLRMVIETPKGGERSGPGWKTTMPAAYGYIKGYKGADGDSIDCYVGPALASKWVYCVDQKHLLPRKGYDEVKVMIGFPSAAQAINTYKAGHSNWEAVYMDWTPMTIDSFKQWLASGDHKRPVCEQ